MSQSVVSSSEDEGIEELGPTQCPTEQLEAVPVKETSGNEPVHSGRRQKKWEIDQIVSHHQHLLNQHKRHQDHLMAGEK